MPLPDDSLEKWVYKEHTKVKHEILNKYLEAWTNILGKFYQLNIFDCFAGRGKFSEREDGSPFIIIKALTNVHKKTGRPNKATCFFIEKNKNNFENLIFEINKDPIYKTHRDWLNIECFNEEFSDVATDIIDKYKKNMAPSFFFIDPFGFGGVSFNVIKEILDIRRTEVFISFMVRDVNRFMSSMHHKNSIEELYGIENVSSELSNRYSHLPQDQALLKLYRDRLHDGAKVDFTR